MADRLAAPEALAQLNAYLDEHFPSSTLQTSRRAGSLQCRLELVGTPGQILALLEQAARRACSCENSGGAPILPAAATCSAPCSRGH